MKKTGIYWQRVFDQPFLSPVPGTLAPSAVTTPDLLSVNGRLTLLTGAVAGRTERLISVPLQGLDLKTPASTALESASLVLNPGPFDFDCYHVYDPAALAIGQDIILFYSAIGKGPDCIGQAVSHDGQVYTKLDHAICTGRSPEAVHLNGRLYLYYVLKGPTGGYRIYASVSDDLREFRMISVTPVLDVGPADAWDAYEVTTPRIFERNSVYYMVYAGGSSEDRQDQPVSFGLARSKDLLTWEKYPFNPVFNCGEAGGWDDGALWFGTIFDRDSKLYLLYEAGQLADIFNDSPALTQIGLAKLTHLDFDRAIQEWKP
jgi:predicted GH43/DUF377 family glycosyl hydrolase